MLAREQQQANVAHESADICVRSLASIPVETVRQVIDLICQDEYVYGAVSTDHRAPSFIQHPCVNYLGAFVNRKLVGAFVLVEASDIEIDLHSMLLKEALPYSRELGTACIAHAFSLPCIRRVTAYVSSARPTVINYCKRLGFQVEGVRKDAESRNGVFFDVVVLGVTRQSWVGN